ncbi:hypothetical protein LV564_14320 [Komagataeibacter nataicola]|uniref:hypothetical protein n=1 Tax=Komagataeibacter nataicola TaxID=265960 RepID=UPI0011B80C7F|nr:hypothetical protein [Komagataeibacter nataicola]WEQ55259.1 hypothetical protein LV564_14320 [Komagataeibacter nataicola]
MPDPVVIRSGTDIVITLACSKDLVPESGCQIGPDDVLRTVNVDDSRSYRGQSGNLISSNLQDGFEAGALRSICHGLGCRNAPTGFVASTITGAALRAWDRQSSNHSHIVPTECSANVAAGPCTSLRMGDWQTQGRSSRNIELNGHYISRQPDLLNMDDSIYRSHVRQGNASRWFMSVVAH